MERIIVQYLLNYLLEHGLISSQQHGFLRRKSTSTNLLETWNDFTLTLNNKNDITAAYIDYAKAFDSVSHPKPIHKLKAYGIDGNLLSWISDFRRMRTQCVRVGNSLSNTEKIVSGVIQGSCLGPLLFVIYINDVGKCLIKVMLLVNCMQMT